MDWSGTADDGVVKRASKTTSMANSRGIERSFDTPDLAVAAAADMAPYNDPTVRSIPQQKTRRGRAGQE
jgi:hypothetical protein